MICENDSSLSASIVLPASKTARQENFPVASLILPAALRPAVFAFYDFARAADDIADHPTLSPHDKLARLAVMDEQASLLGEPSATHARALLAAFRRDALNPPCQSWDDLVDYCRHSAMPVGRFLCDLHGEDRAIVFPASDALCAVLQILNHLQDCRKDWIGLSRLYIPADWLAEEGLNPQALCEERSTPALRRVFDRLLDATDTLLAQAFLLPRQIRHRRLRLEAAVIVSIAKRLSALLRRRDPLAEPVRLSRFSTLSCALPGLWRARPLWMP